MCACPVFELQPSFINSLTKYRPEAYVSNEFTFVYLLSEPKSHFIAMNRLSPTERLVGKNREKP